MATTVAFRALDDASKLPDNYDPYYLEDLKHRVSVARAGGKLYAFDDLCKHEGCPLSSGDGSVMPANPGVNPSLMITGLAERAMSLWPNKGEADPRPALGSGYNRLKPVMPHKPIVPAGAPAELRLDAKKEDVIPLYPY